MRERESASQKNISYDRMCVLGHLLYKVARYAFFSPPQKIYLFLLFESGMTGFVDDQRPRVWIKRFGLGFVTSGTPFLNNVGPTYIPISFLFFSSYSHPKGTYEVNFWSWCISFHCPHNDLWKKDHAADNKLIKAIIPTKFICDIRWESSTSILPCWLLLGWV